MDNEKVFMSQNVPVVYTCLLAHGDARLFVLYYQSNFNKKKLKAMWNLMGTKHNIQSNKLSMLKTSRLSRAKKILKLAKLTLTYHLKLIVLFSNVCWKKLDRDELSQKQKLLQPSLLSQYPVKPDG